MTSSEQAAGFSPGRSNFAFYGLLAYTVIFYSQLASRLPALAILRPEFMIGLVLILNYLYRLHTGELQLRENRVNYAVLVFFLAALLNIPFAFVRSTALATFISMFKFFAIYLMIVSAVDSEDKLRKFMFVYLAMIVLLFGEPFLLSLQGKGFMYNNRMWRLAGVTNYFGHPNQLGGITAENLPFFYFFWRRARSPWVRWACLALVIVSLRVIMLTQSRTAFVGVLAFGFFLWVFSRRKILGLAAILLCGALVWSVAPQSTKDRFRTLGDTTGVLSGELSHEEAGSMWSRWALIRHGAIIFMENPVMGVGMDNFKTMNWRRWNHWIPPHNTYIQALSEMGLAGFIPFCLLLVFTFGNLRETGRLSAAVGRESPFLETVSTALTYYLLVRIVVSMFGQDLYANYWWLVAGLSLVTLRVLKMSQQAGAGPVPAGAGQAA